LELDEAVTYRLAFGPADQLLEARAYDCQRGRYRSNAAAGGELEAFLAEVSRRLAIADESGRELAREAVEDVLEGRRPRW
jgi:hypothetical protein